MNKINRWRVRVEMGERGEHKEKRSKALADDVRPVWLRCQWVTKGTGQKKEG